MNKQGPCRSTPEYVTRWKRNEDNIMTWTLLLIFVAAAIDCFLTPRATPLGIFLLFITSLGIVECIQEGVSMAPFYRERVRKQK